MNTELEHRILLQAVSDFALAQSDPAVEKFKPAMRDWGSNWQDVGKAYLPAADLLSTALATNPQTHDLVALFDEHKQNLRWEQSYKQADKVVSDAMLAGYGFAEIIGAQGPFISDCIRCGVGVWGADIVYPRHRHQPEEIYILLAGSAEYKIGDGEERSCQAGDVVFVESMTAHGFRTTDQTLVVYYLWQSGNLREISSFE